MGVFDYLRGLGRALLGRPTNQFVRTVELNRELSSEIHYDVMESRYENSDVYEDVALALRELGTIPPEYEPVKSLRNPVPRVVEVYAANLLQDDLLDHIETPEGSTNSVEPLKPLIRKVWEWAEWIEEAKRAFPTHGVLWLKATSSDDKTRVYPQVLDPRFIPDWEVNERGYLTYVRMEIPQEERDKDGEIINFTHVEVWHKAAGFYRVWNIFEDKDPSADFDELGPPAVDMILDVVPRGAPDPERYTGYDFIPIVFQPFRKVLGRKRGIAPYEHAITNIDRHNELVTKLHDILFPDVIWFLVPPPGPGGEPLPPVRLEGEPPTATLTEAERMGFRVVKTPVGKILRAPGGSTFESKIPQIDFASHLAAIDAEGKVVEELLIELAYYRIRELQLSGIAIDLALRDLVDRLQAARENLENKGVVRFDQMAITIAQVLGIPEFDSVGTFEDGALEHTFAERPIFSSVDQQPGIQDPNAPNGEVVVEPDAPAANTLGQSAQILAQRLGGRGQPQN